MHLSPTQFSSMRSASPVVKRAVMPGQSSSPQFQGNRFDLKGSALALASVSFFASPFVIIGMGMNKEAQLRSERDVQEAGYVRLLEQDKDPGKASLILLNAIQNPGGNYKLFNWGMRQLSQPNLPLSTQQKLALASSSLNHSDARLEHWSFETIKQYASDSEKLKLAIKHLKHDDYRIQKWAVETVQAQHEQVLASADRR